MSKTVNTNPSFARKVRVFFGASRVRTTALVILAIIVILAVGYGAYNIRHQQVVCTDAVVHQAASTIDNFGAQGLKQQVAQIEGQRGYKKDVNCMYITTYYYASIGDAAKADAAFTALQKVYDSNRDDFYVTYGPASVDYGALQIMVQNLHTTNGATKVPTENQP